MNQIKYLTRPRQEGEKTPVKFVGGDEARKARQFHESFPGYRPTPLASLDHLAQALGVAKVFVKDESQRFGLNAFKALGGSYAMGSILAQRLGMDIGELPFEKMTSREIRQKLGEITFVTATDGNHGRGVAWTANQLGQKAVVYMPKGSAQARLRNIQAEGAQASITDLGYDDAVRLAAQHAGQEGWVLVQDTAWEGYEEIPSLIMQGYTTMALEAYEQLRAMDEKPTHLFIQAGVGSLAGAVVGFFADVYGAGRPTAVVVEPETVDCNFRTAQANDGKLHPVTGDYHSIMAGLACGEPTTIGWPVLRDYADAFLSCSDSLAAKGMRILGAPLADDPRVISGESGAVGVGALAELMENPRFADARKALGLDENSKILLFSTEGDTDPVGYRSIVWDGAYASCE